MQKQWPKIANIVEFTFSIIVILIMRKALSQGRNGKDDFYAQPGGGGYSHTIPIRVCAAQRGRDFKAPGLERGIHFRGVF